MDWVNKHLQIVPINTFIDPIFPVENAIITHAHADHAKPGHNNVCLLYTSPSPRDFG